MIFRDKYSKMCLGQKHPSVDCFCFYRKIHYPFFWSALSITAGKVVGISALFSAIENQYHVPIKALFTPEDLPDYHTYKYDECPFCKEGHKIDAIVNSFGYSKI